MSARIWLATIGAGAAVLTACSSSKTASTPPPSTGSASTASGASAGGTAIASHSSAKGTILVNGSGDTLYRFDKDTGTTSTCTGACAATWPAVAGPGTAGAGVDASKLTTSTRPDGTMQVDYEGHPLYTFAGDKAAGDTNGDGVAGIWHVVSVGAASSSPTSSSPAGKGGYY